MPSIPSGRGKEGGIGRRAEGAVTGCDFCPVRATTRGRGARVGGW